MNVVPRFCILSTTTMTPGASMKPRRVPCDVLAVSLLVPACGLLAFGLLALACSLFLCVGSLFLAFVLLAFGSLRRALCFRLGSLDAMT